MKKFNTLFKERQKIRKQEQEMGLVDLSEKERTILEYIASRDGTRIKDITDEEFFEDLSLSTVKRSILILKHNKLVTYISTKDKRECAMVLNKRKVK